MAMRDLIVISLAVLALLWAGVATGAFVSVRSWIAGRWPGSTAELLIGSAVVCLGAVAFALLRWRDGTRQARDGATSEARFQRLIEHMPSVTYTWDPRSSSVSGYVSPQVRAVLGIDTERWTADPKRRLERVHEHDRDRVREALQRGARSGVPVTVEYRFLRDDATVIWLREDSRVVERDTHGAPTLIQGVLLDVTERKRAEQQLAETEGRYRTLVERVPAVTYVWDATYRSGEAPAMYISPQVRQLLGYAPEDFEDPQLWARLVDPEDVERVMSEWAACERGDVAFRSEYRMHSRDGRVVWIRDEAVPIGRDDDGHATFQGVMFDITDRKAAEDRLRAAETRYRTLVEHMPVVAYLIDDVSDPPERYIAPGIAALVGYTQGEWIADPHRWSSVLHPGDRARVLRAREDASRDGTPFRCEYRMVARDGRVVWVVDDAVVVERHTERGAAVWQGVLVDVTARVEAEERLRQAEHTYRTLVEQLPVVVYQDAIDDESTAMYISPQYERMFGYDPAERLRDPSFWIDRLHPDDRDRVLEESRRTNATGDPFVSEYRFLAMDGRFVWIRDEAVLLHDEHGTPKLWQGVLIDIDEQRRTEESLSRRDAILDAVGFAAERFLKSSAPADALTEVLERLGLAAHVSRSYVFRNEDTGYGIAMTIAAEWSASGVVSIDEPSNRRLPYADGYARWERTLSAGEEIHGAVSTFPEGERPGLEAEGVRSLVIVPVFVGAAWWGFLGFDDCVEEREWQLAEIEALKAAADTLGAAIGRAEAEEQRREAEERYRTLVETIPAVTYMQGAAPGDRVYYVSPQVERMLGYTLGEWGLDPEMWLDSVHPDDRERVLAADAETDRTGEPFLVEYRQRRKDGRYIWVRDEAILVRDRDGLPLFWQGIRFDITSEREAEQQVRDAEQRYRALVEHIPAVLYIDPIQEDAPTIYVSPRVQEVLGITQEEYLHDVDRWRELIHPDDRSWVFETYRSSLAGREGWAVEYRVNRPDGRTIWIRDESAILSDADGQPFVIQGVMYDVTERKLAEEALLTSERREREAAERLRALDEMKNTFLAAVSHELRSPLTSILGLALTLEHQELPRDDARDLTARLAQNARKLDRLLRDLLDIDRLSRGIVTPLRHPTDVGELARRTVESLEHPAARDVRIETAHIVLDIDAAKVERIVENLVMNALRHTDDGASIWLRVEPAPGGALIAVDDDGPGVPDELREAIFEPFRQGPSRSRHSPGTGIGLSLVAMFTELHGGRAWVEDREGGGASFRVFLPGEAAMERGREEIDRAVAH
jgi:PAS domain S-box-containing protein